MKKARDIKLNEEFLWSLAAAVVIFGIVWAIKYYVFHDRFAWIAVRLIPEQKLMPRMCYSFLVESTFGAVLYRLRVYQILHVIFVRLLKMEGLYNLIKIAIWTGLISVMVALVHFVIRFLNGVASIAYNVALLAWYLLPALGAAVLAYWLAPRLTLSIKQISKSS